MQGVRLLAVLLSCGCALPVMGADKSWRPSTVSAGSRLPRANAIEVHSPGDRILCLYDSTEGVTADRNPLTGQVAPALAAMGFQVSFHDVARGLPGTDETTGLRAVISGYLDGAMNGAAVYPGFVKSVVDGGVRYVSLGSFGAYQEKSTGTYLAPDRLNLAFESLGVRFESDWTDDPTLFTVKAPVSDLGTDRPLDSAAVLHFFRISPIRDDVRALVEAVRTDSDRGNAASAVVFTSATGAMSLSRYLSADAMMSNPDAFQVDLNGFLREALALRPRDPATLLVLFDPDSDDSLRALGSLSVASSYTGIPLSGVPAKAFRTLRFMDLDTHSGVVFASPDVPSGTSMYVAGLLGGHAKRGGRVLSLLPVSDPDLASVFWNTKARPRAGKTQGIRFLGGGFPGIKGLEVSGDAVKFSGIRAAPGPDCRVMAESRPGPRGSPVPLWWGCRVGRGTVQVLNAFEFADRAYLGFVVQSLLDTEGLWAMPVLAAAVEFVDDCPLPVTDRFVEAMGKEDTRFYEDDFYGMMEEAIAEQGINPTFLAVFSYDDRVRPPYSKPYAGALGDGPRRLAGRILSGDLPVGLHGLNHMSPALSGGLSRSFPDGNALYENFVLAREAFLEVFGPENRPLVYVPPNDYVDMEGKKALVRAVPDVRVIASVFAGSPDETLQDFAWDPDVRGVIDFPRTWAGYVLEDEPVLGMVNGLLVMSVSSHFIHPDDVMDPERSGGRKWAALREGYLEGLREVRNRFTFLREMSAVEAAGELDRILSQGFKVTRESARRLRVTRSSGAGFPSTLLVRLPAGCGARVTSGGELLSSDPDSGRHHVRMDGRELVVGCARKGAANPGSSVTRDALAFHEAR